MTCATKYYKNKNILITGGSKGIGREVVKLLLEYGATVYSISRTKSGDSNKNLHETEFDLLQIGQGSEQIEHLKAIDFDILINNLGSNPGGKPLSDLTIDEINRHVFLNVSVHLYCIKLFKFKKVVFTNSVLGFDGLKNNAVYCASKAFIKSFCDSMRREGVDTYIIHPGKVDTKLFDEITDYMGVKKEDVAMTMVTDIRGGRKTRIYPMYYRLILFLSALLPLCLKDKCLNLALYLNTKKKKD